MTAIGGELKYGQLGLFLGAFALVTIVGGVLVCAAIGATEAAVALAGVGGVGIIGAFINGRRFAHNGDAEEPKESGKKGPSAKK